MTRSVLPSSVRRPCSPLPCPVLVLLVLSISPELVLQIVALIDQKEALYLRHLFYALGAFQPDIISGPGPLFPAQAVSMFITYGFLHTSLSHLIVNMIGLVWLGRLILSKRSSETFLTFYLLSAVGAAEAFALIGSSAAMTVGASGALFGLLGVYLADNGLLFSATSPPHPIVLFSRVLFAAFILAMADFWSSTLLDNPVAWQAHAGGFLTGAIAASLAPPRPKTGS